MMIKAFLSLAGLMIATTASVVVWQVVSDSSHDGDEDAASQANEATAIDALNSLSPGPKIVYREFGSGADTIWAASAENPQQRVALAQVDHPLGWGVSSSLSGSGGRLAVVTAEEARSPGEVWTIDLDDGERRLLAHGADMRIAPIWSNDDRSLVFVSDKESSPALVQVDMNGQATALVSNRGPGLFPIGFSEDGGRFYFAEITAAGTDLGVVNISSGRFEIISHLSDSIARDWKLSPDASSILYLAPRAIKGRIYYQAFSVAAGGGAPTPLVAESEADHFGLIWEADGKALTVGSSQYGATPSSETLSITGQGNVKSLTKLPQGLEMPLSWSPDGRYLLVREFEGPSAREPGRSLRLTITSDGFRKEVSTDSDAEFVGWILNGS